MIQEVSDAIKVNLDTLVGTGQPLAEVFDYYTFNATKFPYATFEYDRIEATTGSSCHNERKMFFDMYIIQEINTISKKDALTILYNAIDTVVDSFDTLQITNIVNQDALGNGIAQFATDNGNVMIANITIGLTYLFNRGI